MWQNIQYCEMTSPRSVEGLSDGVLGILSSIGDISSVGIFNSVRDYKKCGKIFSIVKLHLLEKWRDYLV